MVKLTEAQKVALEWPPERQGSGRTHGGTICGAPPKAALKALINRGLAAKFGHLAMDLWAITEQGLSARSALRAEREREGGNEAMGYNTVAVLYNDFTGEFKTQGEHIGQRIAAAIQDYRGGDLSRRNFGAGVVISQDHADGEQVTIVHGNTGWTADEAMPGSYTELTWRSLDQMQRCLERHGYKVTRPRKAAQPEVVHPRSVHAAYHEWRQRHGGRDYPLNAATVVSAIAEAQRSHPAGQRRRQAIQAAMEAAMSRVAAPAGRQGSPVT